MPPTFFLMKNGISAPVVDTLMFFPTLLKTWKQHGNGFKKAEFVQLLHLLCRLTGGHKSK